jgi:phage FluMu protein Com
MPLTIRCRKCGAKLATFSEAANLTILCRRCKTINVYSTGAVATEEPEPRFRRVYCSCGLNSKPLLEVDAHIKPIEYARRVRAYCKACKKHTYI